MVKFMQLILYFTHIGTQVSYDQLTKIKKIFLQLIGSISDQKGRKIRELANQIPLKLVNRLSKRETPFDWDFFEAKMY